MANIDNDLFACFKAYTYKSQIVFHALSIVVPEKILRVSIDTRQNEITYTVV